MVKYYSLVLVTFSIAVIAMLAPLAEADVSCDTVENALTPCVNFILIGSPDPSADCCNGIKSLLNQFQSKPDHQAVCSCLKSAASSATPGMISNAAKLPSKCGIPNFPYEISPSVDCSKVK